MEKGYIVLHERYTLKGSDIEKFLFDLQNGAKYPLNAEQFNFLSLCDGSHAIEEVITYYNIDSQKVILDFIANLQTIDAIYFSTTREKRDFPMQTVPDIRLQAVHLEFTSKCNMKCMHCYQEPYLRHSDDLSFAEIMHLADEMQMLQVENVSISGGEPLLRNDLFDIMHYIEEHEMRISGLFTNGMLIDENIVDSILACRSNYTIFVSLDAITPEGMQFRGLNKKDGKYAVEAVIRNIRALTDRKIPVVVNTLIHKGNIDYLYKMYNAMRESNVKSWRIGFPKQTGAFKMNHRKFGEAWDITTNACFGILKHHFNQGQPFHLQIEYLFRPELFENFQPLSDDDFVCDYEGRREGCCIKPNGDVASCAYCTDFPLGNIRGGELKNIWYSHVMQKIKNIRIQDVKGCKECQLRSLCGAGCRINAHFLHKDFDNAPDDYACAAVKFFADKVMPFLQERGIL